VGLPPAALTTPRISITSADRDAKKNRKNASFRRKTGLGAANFHARGEKEGGGGNDTISG